MWRVYKNGGLSGTRTHAGVLEYINETQAELMYDFSNSPHRRYFGISVDENGLCNRDAAMQ